MCKMKDSGIEWIGKIPIDWKIVKYKYFAQSGMGLTILKTDIGNKGVPIYSATQSNNIFGYITNPQLILTYGDLIIPARGNSIGYATYISEEMATCTQTTIYSKIKNINKRFLYYCCYGLKDQWFNFEDTAIPQITVGQVQNNPVPIPPISLQSQIADFLDDKCTKIDLYIEKQQQIIEKLKEYKQAIITEAVTKGLDPNVKMKDSGIEWIGEIPEHWNICKFGYIATVKSNLVHPELYKSYPQVSSENIEKNSGKLLECKTVNEVGVISDNHLFYKGQILYSKIRPALNKATIAPFDGLCSADIYPIETTEKTKYILYLLLSEPFLQQVKTITENRVKMPKINRSELNSIFIAYPSKNEQETIIKYLDDKCASIDEVIQKREYIVNKLSEYKKSLIYETVTGKLEV